MTAHLEFDLVTASELLTVTGGSDDPGVDTINQVQKRFKQTGQHGAEAIKDYKQHHYKDAAKQGAIAGLDYWDGIKTAAHPFKSALDEGVAIAGAAGSFAK